MGVPFRLSTDKGEFVIKLFKITLYEKTKNYSSVLRLLVSRQLLWLCLYNITHKAIGQIKNKKYFENF